MQSQDKRKGSRKIFLFGRKGTVASDTEKNPCDTLNACFALTIVWIKVIQFLAVLLIFALVIYVIGVDYIDLSVICCILLIVLSAAYVFVLAVDLISQYGGGRLHTTLAFLFSLLGILFFGVAGILMLVNTSQQFTETRVITTLCLLTCALFLADIMLGYVYRKRKHHCKRCCHTSCTAVYRHDRIPNTEAIKRDLTTSVSSVRLPPDEEVLPDHSYRKIGYGHRREYVDRPTSANSLSAMDIAEVQTDPRAVSVRGIQTRKRDTKEAPVQTLSKCDFCHQRIQSYQTPMPANQAAGCVTCPAVLQVIRGVPCSPGCRCVLGVVQVQQAEQQLQQQREPGHRAHEGTLLIEGVDDVSMPNEKARIGSRNQSDAISKCRLSGIVTKLTVTSYCGKPNKNTQTIDQSVSTNNRSLTYEAPLLHGSENGEQETEIPKADEPMSEAERVNKKEESARTDTEDQSLKIRETKRAGIARVRLNEATQSDDSRSSASPRKSKRTQTLRRRNKIEPVRAPKQGEPECSRSTSRDKTDTVHAAERTPEVGALPEREDTEVCTVCNRAKRDEPPVLELYTVYKDKHGKLHCKFCAPPNSSKVLQEIDVTDKRDTMCGKCGALLQLSTIRNEATETSGVSDVCQKCGRPNK